MRFFYIKFSFIFFFFCLIAVNALNAMTLSSSMVDDIAKEKMKDKTNPIKLRNEKGGKNDGSKKDDALSVAFKNRRKSALSSENFKKENLREKVEVFSISNQKGIQPLLTTLASKPVLGPDPFRFSIFSNKDTVRVGEEFELTITVDWVDFGVNNGVKFLPEWYKYVLKVVMPKGFLQTGGDYVDYCTKTVDAQNSQAVFTIKGLFEYVSQESTFKVLRGFEGANDASEFIFKEELSLLLKESKNKVKNVKLKDTSNITPPSSSRMAGCTTPSVPILRIGTDGNYPSKVDSLYFLAGQQVVLQIENQCVGILHWSTGVGGSGYQISAYPVTTTTYTAYCQNDSCISANSKAVKAILTTDCDKVKISSPSGYNSSITNNIFVNVGDSLTLDIKNNCTIYNSITEYNDGTNILFGGSRIAPSQNKKYSIRCKNGSCVSTTDTLNVFVQCGSVPIPTLTYYNGGSSEFPILYAQANGCSGVIKWYDYRDTYLGTGNRVLLSDYPGFYLNYPRASCTINNCTSKLSNSLDISLIPFNPSLQYPKRFDATISGFSPNFGYIEAPCGKSVIINTGGCQNDKPKQIYILSTEGGLTDRVTTYRFEGTSVEIPVPINSGFSVTNSKIFLECYVVGNNKPTWDQVRNYFKGLRDSSYKVPIRAENNTICTGGTGILYAENCGGTVQWQNRVTATSWSNSVTGDTISVNPTVNTFYRAKCISAQCPNNPWSDSLSVNIDPLLTAPDRPFRPYSYRPYLYGDTLINYSEDPFRPQGMELNSYCNGTTVWSTGQEGYSIFVNPRITTTYTTRCRANGCLSQPSQPLIVKVCSDLQPVITLSRDTISWCGNRDISISVSGCANSTYVLYYFEENGNVIQGATIDSVTNLYLGGSTIVRVKCISKSESNCSSTLSSPKTIYFNGPPKPIIRSNGNREVIGNNIGSGYANFCESQPINLYVNNCPGIVKWYISNYNGNHTYAGTGNLLTFPNLPLDSGVLIKFTDYFLATCTINNCESDRGGYAGIVFKAPTPIITTTSPNQVCIGSNLSILSTSCYNNGDGNVVLNGVIGSENMSVSISKDTTFIAKCRLDYYGCESPNSNTLSFTIKPTPPQLTVSPTTLTICPGDTAILTASACVGYVQWSNGVNGQVLKVVPSATTDYTARCIDDCAVAGPNSSPTTVTIEPLTKPVISALKSLLCSNGIHQDGTITLTATGCAYTVQWSNGLMGNSVTFPTSVTKKFSAVCVRNTCISPPADSLQITVLSIPLPPNISVSNRYKCVGIVRTDNVTAQGYNGGLKWYANSTLLTDTTKVISVSPTVTTKYYTTSTNICGTSNPSPMDSIVIVPIPTIMSIGLLNKSTPLVCSNDANDKLQLQANGCVGTVEWTGGELTGQNVTGATVLVKPTALTTYSARCNDRGCLSIYRDFQGNIFTERPLAITVIGSPIGVGQSARLKATTGYAQYRWFTSTNTTMPFQTTTDSSILVSPTVQTSYFVKCDGYCSELSTQSSLQNVNIDIPPVPTITAATNAICEGSNATVQLTISGCGTGTVVWENGETNTTRMVTPLFTTTYKACCISQYGNAGAQATTTITVNSTLTVKTYPVSVKVGEAVKLAVDVTPTGTYTYNWSGPSSYTSTVQNPQVSASAVKLTHQGIYTVRVSGAASVCSAIATAKVTIIDAQCGCDDCATLVTTDPFNNPLVTITGKNYVVENTYLTASTTIPTGLTPMMQTISYFDGLGRPIQKTAVKAGPGQEDIISTMEYDEFGREATKRLPFAVPVINGGKLISNPVDYIKNYYSKDLGKTADQDYAFAQTAFEASPLNRVLQQGSPGQAWQPTALPTDALNHTVRMAYLVNTKNVNPPDIESKLRDNIKMFTFPSIAATIEAQTVVVGMYDANQLMVNVSTDENGNKMAECKDKEGRVVCKRVQNVTPGGLTEIVETNYAYDDLGQLRFVFQPKASANPNLVVSATAITPLSTTATPNISELVFAYNYDERLRPIEKKVPGMVKTEMVYDKRDRLVYSIDGWGRMLTATTGRSKGVYARYDDLNRVVESGYYTVLANQTCGVAPAPVYNSSTNPRAFAQCKFDAATAPAYDFLATVPVGDKLAYLNNVYDAYPTGDEAKFDLAHAYSQAKTSNVKGMLVKSIDKVLHNNTTTVVANILNANITTLMFYDNLGRSIQTNTLNHTNKTDIASSQLDFAGRVTASKSSTNYTWRPTSGSTVALPAIVIENKTTYDYGGRVASVCQKNDADTWEPVVRNSYSKIGELLSKKMGCDIQNVDYQYNIRSWLTKINDPANLAGNNRDLFGLNLTYNDATQFNGNITKLEWNTLSKLDNLAVPKGLQQYVYSYDKMNRLLTADFSSPVPALNSLGISVTMINGTKSYDVNGNIGFMKRTVNGVIQDNLTYMYEGTSQLSNRLMKIDDAGNQTDRNYFFDVAGTDYTYNGNGNLTKDGNKLISAITYTHTNLPALFTGTGANVGRMKYYYTFTGKKVRTEVLTTATGSVFVNEKTIEYVNGLAFKGGALEFVPTAEGRALSAKYVWSNTTAATALTPPVAPANQYRYEYQLKDHLGDLRVSCRCGDPKRNASGDMIAGLEPTMAVQENHYDPWGLGFADAASNTQKPPKNTDRFQFNGEEKVSDLGLNLYDYGARHYDPAMGRWISIDPLSEEREWVSPYNYAQNNPIMRIDPDGALDQPCCGETGAAVGGFVTGLGEAVVRNVKALTVNLPETIQGFGSLGNPVGQMQAAVGGAMLYDKTKSDWNAGDTRTRANIVGNIVGEIGIAVAGSKGVGSLGKAGVVADVAKAGEVAEMVSVYRGVNSTSPAFAAAESGVVKSRGGILGHSDALTHNTGANGTANSKMTSWTTNPEVAKNFALRTSGNGVVLSQQVPTSSLISSPNLKTVNLIQGGGRVSESEVLLKGTQRNLNVQRIGQ